VSEYDDDRGAAEAALAAGDLDGALQRLRGHLRYPQAAPPAPARLADALGLLTRVFDGLGHRALADAAGRAAVDVHDPDALYQLGYELVEVGLPEIAATVLGRCLEIIPGSEDVVTELAAALQDCLCHRDAQRLLEAHPELVESSFLCRYLLAFNAAMAGDVTTARRHAGPLAAAATGPDQALMAGRIAGFVARADRVAAATALDGADLRGWHYVLTGGLLAHLSPYGFDQPMRGRYAWLQDSPDRVRTGLDRLAGVLAAWGARVPCVYAPPGRDHEIVGLAAARVLGVELAPWPAVGVPAPGLVAIYDLAGLEVRDAERLIERRPGQIVFAHACRWTADGPIAPDVTTLLHQSLVAPWGPRLVVDPDTRATRRGAPDDRPAEAIAAEVAAAPALGADDVAADQLDAWDRLIGAAGPPGPGRRERLWAGSPVPSAKFD
jgi:hypothetical protein